jgi:hypothetical protein
MKTLELTEDACKLIADGLTLLIGRWEDHNRMIKIWQLDDVAQEYINKNNIKIGELKTLLDYITA